MTHTVLLIEDNAQNRYLATFLLQHHGYRVIDAADGPSGIARARECRPAAILLDIQLPLLDGYAVARELRRIDTLADTPIIAFTSYAMSGDREKALAAGCNGHIEKPIDPDTFIATVAALIATGT